MSDLRDTAEHSPHCMCRACYWQRRSEKAEAERDALLKRRAPGRGEDTEIARLTEERDLAIAHDRQPYPTAWAYEQAVKALETQRERAERAEVILRALVDPDPCRFDRPGFCQGHGYRSPCPHARAREHLAAIDQPGDEPTHEADPQAVDPQWLDRLHTVQSREPDDQPKEPT